MLTRWLKRVGLTRKEIYITNVYPYRPPGNDLRRIPYAELQQWTEQLHLRLAALDGPIVIVPMGNFALQAIIGKSGITKHRGSIYQYTDRRGREIKVIPTLHPAAIFRQQKWERRCIRDWQRIASDSQFADLRLPQRTHEIMPTIHDVELFLVAAKAAGTALAVDIETPIKWKRKVIGHTKKGTPKIKKEKGARFIACVGFANSAEHSLTIPTTRAYWGDKDELARAWELIRALLALPNEKIFQNGWFDTFHFNRLGMPVRNWRWDTMALHHVLIPNEDHSLAFMGSVDTRQPYWKDDSKSQDKGIPVDLETYWRYNGIDCCVTWELHAKYIKDLEACGRLDLYLKHHRRLFKPLLQMSVEGIRSDEHRRKQRFAQLTADLIRLRTTLTALAGEELYGKKGSLSTKKLRAFLYDKLGLPPMTKGVKGEQKITTDEIAVRKYQLKFGRKRPEVNEACQLILDHRRSDKLRSFYAAKTCDEDSRIRCSYSIAPESGRLSSSKNPMGSGMNLQNVDREARDHFIPDEGHILLRIDMAQVESRYVYMFTGDEELIEKARSKPWEYDDHRTTAAIIFGVQECMVNKDQRYFGKRVNHASNYDMQGKRMSDEMLKDGVVETPERGQAMIEARMDAAPAIRSVFHRETRRMIMTERCLVNSWGHRLDLTDIRLGPDVFREGYAFRASSEASFTINRWGLIPAFKYCKGRDAKLRNQVHDELVFSVAPAEAWDLYQFVKQSMERPRPTPYGELMVPVTLKIGVNWGSGHEWQKPPQRKEFEEVIRDTRAKAK
jgi:uracil-DNA glycosylase family 4